MRLFAAAAVGAADQEQQAADEDGGDGGQHKQGGDGVDEPDGEVTAAVGEVGPAFAESDAQLLAEALGGFDDLGILDDFIEGEVDG